MLRRETMRIVSVFLNLSLSETIRFSLQDKKFKSMLCDMDVPN